MTVEKQYPAVLEIVRRVLREWHDAQTEYASTTRGYVGFNAAFERLNKASAALNALAATMPPFPIVPEVAEDLEGGVIGAPSYIPGPGYRLLYFDGELVAFDGRHPIPKRIDVVENVFFDMPPIAWWKPW